MKLVLPPEDSNFDCGAWPLSSDSVGWKWAAGKPGKSARSLGRVESPAESENLSHGQELEMRRG